MDGHVTPDVISSKSNSRIKNVRKLRSRSERERTGTLLVEGIRQVSEAIQSGAEIVELLIAPDLLRSRFALDLVSEAQDRGVKSLNVTSDVFQSFSERERPQGLAAEVRQRWTPLESLDVKADRLWVALESVADPGNLGTILRTCDAVGANGAIVLGQSTDPFDPASVRASMGAVFTQQIVRASTAELVAWARTHRIHLAGTSPDAKIDYHATDYPSPLVLLMGSERHGLTDELMGACNPLVKLPMAGRVDSLNLAVATGVVLYEIFNQRRSKSDLVAKAPVHSRSRRRPTSDRGVRSDRGRGDEPGRRAPSKRKTTRDK